MKHLTYRTIDRIAAVRHRPGVALGLIVLAAVVGYLVGFATSSLPTSHDPDRFWIANVGAIYSVLPFTIAVLIAYRGLGRLSTVVGGIVTCAGMVCGFYRLHAVGADPQADVGYEETRLQAYGRWFSQFVLGPGGAPWLTIAVIVGAVAGLLAWLYVARARIWAGVLAVLPLVLEPAIRAGWRVDLPLLPAMPITAWNATVWLIEAFVGVLAIAFVVRHGPLCGRPAQGTMPGSA